MPSAKLGFISLRENPRPDLPTFRKSTGAESGVKGTR